MPLQDFINIKEREWMSTQQTDQASQFIAKKVAMFCNKRILVYRSVHTIWITLGFRVSRSLHQQQKWKPLLASPNIIQRWWNASAFSLISAVTHCTSHQLVIILPHTTQIQQCSVSHSLLTVKRLTSNGALIQLPSFKTNANGISLWTVFF